ncbi:ankyrin repeat domain-containing protein 12-like [Oppia nitens]|uniref:ankyrin repeat domain-containing protein 12-like n=1 Tax=Oppia nitens TaxID=1686743 RepID=UPI0023DCE0F7|nr:ankyrin repeat domain-containing protein 12-like [Oppia nitens]
MNMSDDENRSDCLSVRSETSDYFTFSESTPKSVESIYFDHKYARSPPYSTITSSTTSNTSPSTDPKRKLTKKHKLFKGRRLFDTKSDSCLAPLSERQQLAIALQLSSNTSPEHETTSKSKYEIKSSQRVRRNPKGETDLHIAAIKGDLSRVQQIIADNKYHIDITDFAGWSPIHEACNRGFIHIVDTLLKAGSDVNARGYNKDTPLIDAAVNGHHHLVSYLLRHGANYFLTNGSNKTALEVAKSPKVVEVIKSFIDEKMRKNGGNSRDNNNTNKSRSSSPTNSPVKPSSPRLTLRFHTIKDSKSLVTNLPNSTTMSSTKTYSVSSASDKDSDTTNDYKNDKQNDNNRINTSNGNNSEPMITGVDHNYTSVDSTQTSLDESNRSRKRRKSNDGNVSSTSNHSGGASSRSGSSSSVGSSTQSTTNHNKKHHSHHHHMNITNKTNNVKDKSGKRIGSSSDSECVEGSDCDKESNSKETNFNATLNATSSETNSPKVPPLRIVLPANSSNTTSTMSSTISANSSNSTISSSVASSTTNSMAKFPYVVTSEESFQSESDSVSGAVGSQRITRSSQRVAQQQNQRSNHSSAEHHSDSEESAPQTDSQHPRKRKIRNNNNITANLNNNNTNNNNNNTSITSNNNNNINDNKRDLNTNNSNTSVNNSNGDNDNDSSSSTSSVTQNLKDISQFALPQTNCYQMYLSIRKNVEKKRKEMFSVPPKAPQGFADYLLNRCSYLLHEKCGTDKNGSNNSNKEGIGVNIMSKPNVLVPPSNLNGSKMIDVFNEQEKQRNKLRIQHMIERQKLILSAEQEILRVHGRAARAMANQSVPFSVCSILKDEEIYNIFETESEQNDSLTNNHLKGEKSLYLGTSGMSANRTRYNGRLLLSWLQDVADKWQKTKEVMLLRHKKESESMVAMQRLEWEWKLKEFGLCDLKTNPNIDGKHVPLVNVSDDFELFPV